MPIEFRCSRCGKLLRTGDDTAGRQAQCPECGTIGTVPGPAEPKTAMPPPLAAPDIDSPIASGSPFADAAGSQNADRSPFASAYGTPPAQRVSGPAIALIVTAALSLFLHLAAAALYATVIVMATKGQIQGQDPSQMVLGGSLIVAESILGLILDSVVLIGAIKMKNLSSYAFAMAAAIIAMIPCSACCVLGLPFGIWAIVVLGDSSVKAAFKN